MKKEETFKLAEKLGINKEGLEEKYKLDPKGAEELVKKSADFMEVK